jgi:hypothetical protein
LKPLIRVELDQPAHASARELGDHAGDDDRRPIDAGDQRISAGQDVGDQARAGSGTAKVKVSGLAAGIASGTVYTENRSIQVANGAFTRFAQWGVHVYRFVPDSSPAVNSLHLSASCGHHPGDGPDRRDCGRFGAISHLRFVSPAMRRPTQRRPPSA